MRENTTEVIVGGIVLAVAVGFLAFTLRTTGVGTSAGYDLSASFRSVEGISTGTDIRLAGVKIGTVSDITLNADTFRGDTVLTIRPDVVIPDDSRCFMYRRRQRHCAASTQREFWSAAGFG